MTSARLVWVAGSALAVIALLLAILTASALPLGYDSKAYWLAARHLVDGTPVFPLPFGGRVALTIDAFVWLWLAVQLALAIAVGIALIRPLPSALRPWAA